MPRPFVLAVTVTITTLSLQIRVDQLGYRPTAQKIAVLSDPLVGYDAALSFTPGAVYEVRRWADDASVLTGAPVAWRGGATHAQSGDRVWHFDFSALQEPGAYYVWDVQNGAGSHPFEIRDDVYNPVLREALRAFYYQRCGMPRAAEHAGVSWADPACHLHAQQDLDCRSVTNPVAGSAHDLSGGWHDAGDYNKYVNFADGPVHDLLSAYEQFPGVFGDASGLPESGNGVPDVLDEVRHELDWLLRMQRADGSLLHKVSVTDFAAASPPSSDTAPRRYAPATASATISGAGVFAHAAVVYGASTLPAMRAYAATLEAAALAAWQWLAANPGAIPSAYGNQGFQNVAAEDDAYQQMANRVCAAAYLYRLTGDPSYRSHVDANHDDVHLVQWHFAYPFESEYQDCLLYYATTAGATASVAATIRSRYQTSVSGSSHLAHHTNADDPYRAHLADQDYTWGSNRTKAAQGSLYVNMLVYGLDAAHAGDYRDAAEGFLHYLHGVNPNGMAYLSNLGAIGAERSVPELYHAWFADGTAWDSVETSASGPAPGIVVGGANPAYAPDPAYSGPPIEPPMNQPVQKSFRAWNTSWPENSWEVTENSISYQAAVVRLLAAFAAADSDGDGRYDFEDCAPSAPATWASPSAARNLRLAGGATTELTWSAPVDPGSTSVAYDLLRAESPANPAAATCVSTATAATTAMDAGIPASLVFYLVRSRSDCGANAGADSSGTPRIWPECP
jgi:hypothetical protein